jgi:4-hydroxy-4-methyl-2-oxoglutarate aldolase
MGEPRLRIRREVPRLPSAVVARFAGTATGHVCDAQQRWGSLTHHIRPMTKHCAFAGSALTVWAGPRDNLGPWAALKLARPGDVLMIATDGYAGAAVVGDLLVGMAKNAGCVAVVTDGLVRDRDGLDACGIPVFAAGLTPNSPWKNGPAVVGEPVALGGRSVASGDVVVGDIDGVVVVPAAAALAVADGLAAVRAKEGAMEAEVAAGRSVPGWVDDLLAGDEVEWS